jgi:HD-GYP domain-containing protein (c-di-GMP phosphodiesterase class II)
LSEATVLLTKPGKPHSKRVLFTGQTSALAVVLREEFGVGFAFYNAADGTAVPQPPESDPNASHHPPEEVCAFAAEGRARVRPLPGGAYELWLLTYDGDRPALVVVGVLAGLARSEAAAIQEHARLEKWVQSFADRLRLANQFLGRHRPDTREEAQTALAWETILTLGQLLQRLRIHKEPARNQKRILHAAFGLARVQTLIWVPAQAGAPVLMLGDALLSSWDCRQLATLLASTAELQKHGLLISNEVAGSSWGPRYPQIANLLVLPTDEQAPTGWLIAVNKGRGARGEGRATDDAASILPEAVPFRRTDAALLTPFVALLDLHTRASGRYGDLKELLVGLTRSLTAAIDAKDSYTYGHSERVARIAVELGRELGLQEDELSDIYLAGLLHDIGKIGIRDAILGKREPLTPEEFEHIKQHVTIGYKILADLRPIRNLLPGVLYHHERYDGGGYPDALAGDQIPLLARILAVADAYDAMSTARPYRTAMPLSKVEEILLQGAGTHWDRRIIDAFLRCRDRVHVIRQRGVGESLCHALDGALRGGDSSRRALPAPDSGPG